LQIVEAKTNGNYFNCLALELLRSPLVIKNYSRLGFLVLIFYILTLPLAVIFYGLSFLIKGSDKQMTFSYHILAKKL
jgi:hypothetical protein